LPGSQKPPERGLLQKVGQHLKVKSPENQRLAEMWLPDKSNARKLQTLLLLLPFSIPAMRRRRSRPSARPFRALVVVLNSVILILLVEIKC